MGEPRDRRRLAVATAFAVAGLTATTAQSYAAVPASPASHRALAVPAGYRVVPAAENVSATSALAALNGHIYFSGTGYRIVASAATLARVSTTALAGIEAGFAADSAGISHGTARMTSNAQIAHITSAGISQHALDRYRDVTIGSHWWGYEVWFDAWATNHIIYGIAGGGIVAVISKEAGRLSWVVTAAITAVGVYANFCKHRDGTTDFVFIGRLLPFLSWYCR